MTTEAKRPRFHFLRRLFAPPVPLSEQTPLQRKYDNISSLPMFIAAMVWLLATFFTWAPPLRAMYHEQGVMLSIVTWCIFALDMLIRFAIDPLKDTFVKHYWPLLIALAFPPLRIILVIAAVMRVARDRNALAKIVGLYALYAVLFVVLMGATLTLIFEIDAPGANILSFGDSVWWGFVTVTTVGYGDFTPVTVGGRVVAVVIMFTGAAAVGAVTAAVASRFISNSNAPAPAPEPTPQNSSPAPEATGATSGSGDVTLSDLAAQLSSLTEQVSALTRSLGDTPATRAGDGE